jgi:hypothetical protein
MRGGGQGQLPEGLAEAGVATTGGRRCGIGHAQAYDRSHIRAFLVGVHSHERGSRSRTGAPSSTGRREDTRKAIMQNSAFLLVQLFFYGAKERTMPVSTIRFHFIVQRHQFSKMFTTTASSTRNSSVQKFSFFRVRTRRDVDCQADLH